MKEIVDRDEQTKREVWSRDKAIAHFKKKGEFKFRELERKIILKLLKKKGCIISFGGGAFLNKTIRKVANEKGITVWLNWNSKTLIDRINRKKNKRPIASNLTNSKLKDLMLKI